MNAHCETCEIWDEHHYMNLDDEKKYFLKQDENKLVIFKRISIVLMLLVIVNGFVVPFVGLIGLDKDLVNALAILELVLATIMLVSLIYTTIRWQGKTPEFDNDKKKLAEMLKSSKPYQPMNDLSKLNLGKAKDQELKSLFLYAIMVGKSEKAFKIFQSDKALLEASQAVSGAINDVKYGRLALNDEGFYTFCDYYYTSLDNAMNKITALLGVDIKHTVEEARSKKLPVMMKGNY